jgi:hypothetical protein
MAIDFRNLGIIQNLNIEEALWRYSYKTKFFVKKSVLIFIKFSVLFHLKESKKDRISGETNSYDCYIE